MKNQRNDLSGSAAMSKGMFTLIELMVVVGIIAILASFLFSSLTRTRETAMQVYCNNNLKQLSSASVLYRNDHKKLPFAEKYYMDDFSKIYSYLQNLKVFVCAGNPQSVGNVPNVAALNGGTDYLYWPGGGFEAIEEKNHCISCGVVYSVYGKIGLYRIRRVAADKSEDVVIYDRCGPAHCDSINIIYLQDMHVQAKRDMCDLWMLNTSRKLMWKSGTSDPFPPLTGG